jgi:hypothetical protein
MQAPCIDFVNGSGGKPAFLTMSRPQSTSGFLLERLSKRNRPNEVENLQVGKAGLPPLI